MGIDNANISSLIAPEELSSLNATQKKMLEYTLMFEGIKTGKEIAKDIGITEEYYSLLKKDDRIQKVYQKVRGRLFNNTIALIQDASVSAIKELHKMIESDDEYLKLKAIKILLDYQAKTTPTVSESRTTVQLNSGLL